MRVSKDEQERIVTHVSEVFQGFNTQLTQYRDRMNTIYEKVTSFKWSGKNQKKPRQTDFKVNKMFEIENKVLPRIIANTPKWIVSLKTDEFDESDKDLTPEERTEKFTKSLMYADAIRDYLTYTFNKYELREVNKLRAKTMVRYGMGWVRVSYKYDMVHEEGIKEETYLDENGEEQKRDKKSTKEKIIGEYPTIENAKLGDVYYDPRFVRLDDAPAIIEVKSGVRLSFFTRNPSKYMNIRELIDICNLEYESGEHQSYIDSIYDIIGIQTNVSSPINKQELTVKKYYGWYEMGQEGEDGDGSGEKLYEFRTVDDAIVVYSKEITQIPFGVIKCFEDTDTFLATGFLESIMGMQDEMNFKKNRASDYINQATNRSYFYSPNSGINPKHLISKPGGIIYTSKDAKTAMDNVIEVPHRQLTSDHFNEQNDLERQIQGMTFTVDTASSQSNQAMTNTATGIKVKAFESNSVIDMVTKNYEDGVKSIAYKFLQVSFENMDDNITLKKMGDNEFWEVNKEALRDAVRRYDIRIEAGSTSFDSQEQRRADAIAQWNIAQQAAAAGVQVDLDAQYKRLMETFEGVDVEKLLKKQNPMDLPGIQKGQAPKPLATPPPTKSAGNIPL